MDSNRSHEDPRGSWDASDWAEFFLGLPTNQSGYEAAIDAVQEIQARTAAEAGAGLGLIICAN